MRQNTNYFVPHSLSTSYVLVHM
ncbi:hypothetical protein Zm00014a_037155 [Zea mays]|uniref:Uncharacterized protein n=1 Tax=Zea mays TaxID=4577 RepID=A0A3L6G1V6_MAIZE|nr:hypothetical protein Zm00014a_037155 [Zea mays]